jgi:hypothetical protein
MRNIFFVIALAVLSASSASAQQLRDQKPDKPAAVSIPLRAPKAAANSCAEYGPGFVKVEGSSTCMKIGGSISVGVGGSR